MATMMAVAQSITRILVDHVRTCRSQTLGHHAPELRVTHPGPLGAASARARHVAATHGLLSGCACAERGQPLPWPAAGADAPPRSVRSHGRRIR
jgi:hypothetical protein